MGRPFTRRVRLLTAFIVGTSVFPPLGQGQTDTKSRAFDVVSIRINKQISFATSGTPSTQLLQMSSAARLHLSEIVTVLQREWLYRRNMDWMSFQQQVFEKAGTAQTIDDTHDAIRLALMLLGDRHSYYVTPSGESIFNPQSPTQTTGECTPAPFVRPAVPANIGYVRIQITPPTPPAVIQQALRNGDRPGTIGWIVDLRNSRGGNTWPALVGIGSLLGDGTAGFFVDADGHSTPWGYTNGRAWLESPDKDVAYLETPYKLSTVNPPVAVLTDIGVASSGEAIAVAFRARSNTRSFGTPTCGLSTAITQFPLRWWTSSRVNAGHSRPHAQEIWWAA
jgi:C-terminal processing protease CtpA/Prc